VKTSFSSNHIFFFDSSLPFSNLLTSSCSRNFGAKNFSHKAPFAQNDAVMMKSVLPLAAKAMEASICAAT